MNRDNQQAVRGIYCAPQITDSLDYANPVKVESTGKSYRLILQCRVDFRQVLIPKDRPEYWIIPDGKYIRPYGIILVKEGVDISRFGNKFSYENYRKQIEGERLTLNWDV